VFFCSSHTHTHTLTAFAGKTSSDTHTRLYPSYKTPVYDASATHIANYSLLITAHDVCTEDFIAIKLSDDNSEETIFIPQIIRFKVSK